jgi:hypothetical protein
VALAVAVEETKELVERGLSGETALADKALVEVKALALQMVALRLQVVVVEQQLRVRMLPT